MEDPVRTIEQVCWRVEFLGEVSVGYRTKASEEAYRDLARVKDEDAVVRDDCPQTVYDAGINQFWGAEVGI